MPAPSRTALLSLSDRSGLEELAGTLSAQGFRLVATSGTAAALQAAGFACLAVEDVTRFAPILGGRVKTLHPAIFGAILADTDQPAHHADLERHGLSPISVVAVTLYPFEQTLARHDATHQQIVEDIDVGGVALLRAAAKNYEHVCVLSHPRHYEEFRHASRSGFPDRSTRRVWAARAMALVSRYDSLIAGYLQGQCGDLADPLVLALPLKHRLRYGENPWTQAAFYHDDDVADVAQLSGKTLSYNNILDIDSCLRLIAPIDEPAGFPAAAAAAKPVRAAIVKHTLPCGFAAATVVGDAVDSALGADPISAFGGIVAVNARIDERSATSLAGRFLEVVAAPAFDPLALQLLQRKKNLRLLTFEPDLPARLRASLTVRSALGGVLAERPDPEAPPDAWTSMTDTRPDARQWRDLLFAFGAVRQVKSNAAVVVRDETAIGVCGGQTNRVAAVELACKRAGTLARSAVLATDGFFPFADGIEAAIAAGISAVVAPSGSIRDAEVVAAARAAKIALVFTSRRYFLH
ncbi:MAG: bifunctional phosphoribosylaminoimidazolecarboxamide formyltransferase/IMP cyclohydrolase [Candidatus Eremiobacteraeota bacterium]|nr:bifunctional phosphoribosylaminoimidazolecarboxamide formyltransferase/IMP cyclohydrolase [Candidatus Eremiobacteraeota bacterium]